MYEIIHKKMKGVNEVKPFKDVYDIVFKIMKEVNE